MPVPSVTDLYNPVLRALKMLGGSASNVELDEETTRLLRLSEEDVSAPHNERITELQYRLAWARSHLKIYGLVDNSARGVWVLTLRGKEVDRVEPGEVRRFIHARRTERQSRRRTSGATISMELRETDLSPVEQTWRDELLRTLLALSPSGFERLCQRLLRESGFVQVRVTGQTGDGGIDGVGIVRIGGLLGFPVLFQCKRYQGVVGPGTIRDFRGAMIGRADRGLVLTTGTFSRDARNEATRDGAPPIDLVDGEQFLDKLKELQLGVRVRMIEEVTVDEEWFQTV